MAITRQPLTYAPGDVVKIKGRGDKEEIISDFSNHNYATTREAWFSFSQLIFVRRADAKSIKRLNKELEEEFNNGEL